MATGYQHPRYAQSFAEWGAPRPLGESQGWALERRIDAAGNHCDAMGCYPLFSCPDWSRLAADLDRVVSKWVSLTLVADPFVSASETDLKIAFPHLMRSYKDHFVVELGRAPSEFVHPHHLRNARRAGNAVQVRFGDASPPLLNKWIELYAELIARHSIRGLSAFSPSSFALQFEVPGLTIEWAELEGKIAGMLLWYAMGDRVCYHLGAYSQEGYASRCSFALFLAAIEHFAASDKRWLNLGAGAGASNDGTDGLTRFKRGWATGTRPCYLCGRIFDPERYDEICTARGISQADYFPAYRYGEFR